MCVKKIDRDREIGRERQRDTERKKGREEIYDDEAIIKKYKILHSNNFIKV